MAAFIFNTISGLLFLATTVLQFWNIRLNTKVREQLNEELKEAVELTRTLKDTNARWRAGVNFEAASGRSASTLQ